MKRRALQGLLDKLLDPRAERRVADAPAERPAAPLRGALAL
ncbi:hypothetical protein [Pseudomonas sp. No.117]